MTLRVVPSASHLSLLRDLQPFPLRQSGVRVRGLEKRGWVIINDEIGIDLNIDSPVNQLIVEEVHPFEKQEFVKLLSKICKLL